MSQQHNEGISSPRKQIDIILRNYENASPIPKLIDPKYIEQIIEFSGKNLGILQENLPEGDKRYLDFSAIPTFARYLQQQTWIKARDRIQKKFPGQNLKAYDAAAGNDRTILALFKPEQSTLGNDNPSWFEQDKEQQYMANLTTVTSSFPRIPVSDASQHIIFLHGFNVFDLKTLKHIGKDDQPPREKALNLLKELRRACKTGGELIITQELRAQLGDISDQITPIQTLGTSALSPAVNPPNYGWQEVYSEKGKNEHRVGDVYSTESTLDIENIKKDLQEMGWNIKITDVVEDEQATHVRMKGAIIPSTQSVHQRQTFLPQIAPKMRMKKIVLEAV